MADHRVFIRELGRSVSFPKATSIEDMQIALRSNLPNMLAAAAPQPVPQRPTLQPLASERFGPGAVRPATAAEEVFTTIATGAAAEPISGIAGLVQSINPFAEPGAGARTVKQVQEALTFQPRTEEGKAGLQAFGEAVAGSAIGELAQTLEETKKRAGQAAFEKFGPTAGALTEGAISVLPDLLGLKTAKILTTPVSRADLSIVRSFGGGFRALESTDLFDLSNKKLTVEAVKNNRDQIALKIDDPEINSRLELANNALGKMVVFFSGTGRFTKFVDFDGNAVRVDSNGSVTKIPDNEVKPFLTDEILKGNRKLAELEAPEIKAAAKAKKDEVKRLREEQRVQLEETYQMQHRAPTRGDNPSGPDINDVMPDIYTGNAKRFYGTGVAYDDKAFRIIQSMKGKPEKKITVYRAVPKEVKEINTGDWIATTREYARDHMEGEVNWHILTKKVKAKDIATDGNSIHEWGYDPDVAPPKIDLPTSDALKQSNPNLKIGIRESANEIVLDKVIVEKGQRGLGGGTKFMNELVDIADQKGKTISLTPSSDFGGSKKRLVEFYKRFGFVENKGKNRDFEISEAMFRLSK